MRAPISFSWLGILLFFFLVACKKQTGIDGNNNTGNTIIIADNATLDGKQRITGKAPENIFYLVKIGMSLQYIKQLLGEPKISEFNKSLNYNQYLWELDNLFIRISSDSLDKTAEAIEFKLRDASSEFLLDSIYTGGLLKSKFFGQITYKDVFSTPFYVYKGYRGNPTYVAIIPGMMTNRLIRYEFTSFYDFKDWSIITEETAFDTLISKLQSEYDIKSEKYTHIEEEREGYTDIWMIEDAEMLGVIENGLSRDRIEVIRIIRDYDGNEKYYYTGYEAGFYDFENL